MPSLRKRHRLAFFSRGAGSGEWGSGQDAWAEVDGADDVPALMEFLAGTLTAAAAGRELGVTARAYVSPKDLPVGFDVKQGMGVKVIAGSIPGGPRYRVQLVEPAAVRGFDHAIMLEDTQEVFGG